MVTLLLMKRPSLHQLEIFCTIVKLSSMARAAEELYLSPSSVSTQVQDLERKLGVALLVRSGRRVGPTPAGELLYARAQRVLDTLEAFEQDLAQLAELDAGTLRFAASRGLGLHVVPSVLRTFELQHPRIVVEYQVSNSSEGAKLAVAEGRAEFALLGRVPGSKVIEVSPLVEEHRLVVVAPHHPLAAVERPTVQQLAAHTLALRRDTALDKDHIARRFAQVGIQPALVELPSNAAIKAEALRGKVVGILPHISVARELDSGLLVQKSMPGFAPSRTVYLACLRNTRLSPAGRAFVELTAELLRRRARRS
jgi:DNA-binding transcriptional LysR family regulator